MVRYEEYDREQWARFGRSIRRVPTAGGTVPPTELVDVYLPLAELIGTRVADARPFVVAITGSVAVGKSAAAAALAAVLAAVLGPGSPAPAVDVVGTDGFLFPNRVLAARGLAHRKGFPESYDHEALVAFVTAVRSGAAEVSAPVYSHATYDVVDGAAHVVRRPSVLILEGLPFPADHVDLTVYLDADETDIEAWYVTRFLELCVEAQSEGSSFFGSFGGYSHSEATELARQVWAAINHVNLHEHILPTRDSCDVILEKGPDHAVRRVRLRLP